MDDDLYMFRPFYLSLARRHGIPDAFAEDCVQEIVIRVWRAGSGVNRFTVASRACIDFARSLTSATRGGLSRKQIKAGEERPGHAKYLSSLEGFDNFDIKDNFDIDVLIELWDVKTEIAKLTPRQREALFSRDKKLSSYKSTVRQRLRKACLDTV